MKQELFNNLEEIRAASKALYYEMFNFGDKIKTHLHNVEVKLDAKK